MTRAVEITMSTDFDRYLNAISRAANRPLTEDEIIKRWIVLGMAADFTGANLQSDAINQAAGHISRHVRIMRK